MGLGLFQICLKWSWKCAYFIIICPWCDWTLLAQRYITNADEGMLFWADAVISSDMLWTVGLSFLWALHLQQLWPCIVCSSLFLWTEMMVQSAKQLCVLDDGACPCVRWHQFSKFSSHRSDPDRPCVLPVLLLHPWEPAHGHAPWSWHAETASGQPLQWLYVDSS